MAQGKFNWSLHYCKKNLLRKDDSKGVVEEEILKIPKGEKLFLEEIVDLM